MAEDFPADPDCWDGPIPREPDPEAVGPAIVAWYALHDALHGGPVEAADTVAWAADVIAGKLGAFGSGVANPLSPRQASIAIKDAKMLLGMIAEIFGQSELPADDEAALVFKATLTRRGGAGRPGKTGKLGSQSLGWWGVAREVESLMAAGDLQKVAVGKVAKRLGLKDAVVAGWCRERRKSLEVSKGRYGDTENSTN